MPEKMNMFYVFCFYAGLFTVVSTVSGWVWSLLMYLTGKYMERKTRKVKKSVKKTRPVKKTVKKSSKK